MNKFTETAKTTVAIKPQADIDTADVTSAVYVSMAEYRRVYAIASCEGPGAGKILTAQLKQATDASGSGAKNLGTAATATATASEDLVAVAEANVEDMDTANGFYFVGVTIGTNKTSAVDGACTLTRDRGRYSE